MARMLAAALAALTASAAPAQPPLDLMSAAAQTGRLSTFIALAEAAGIADNLATEGPFTIFAPTDEAFAALPEGTVEALMQAENFAARDDMVVRHVIPGTVMAADMLYQDYAAGTLAQGRIVLDGRSGTIRVGPATVIEGDIEAGNGVLHLIDRVLPPQ
jgi:uncharacterized surface protein with fasciclin (FAS1) repeats